MGTTVHYLRKTGTNCVFVRTATLALRPDMVAISEEEVQACVKRQTEDARKRSVTGQVEKKEEKPTEEALTASYVDSLDEAALRALAEKMKIAVRGNWGVKALRNYIKEAIDEAKKDGLQTPDIETNPKAKSLMERISKVDAADESELKKMVEELKIMVPEEATADDLKVLIKSQLMEDEPVA